MLAPSSSSASSKGMLPLAASGGTSLPSSVCGLLVPPGGGGGAWQEEGIPVLERLIRTHPVWYLPGVGRAEATHLLHQHEPGVSTTLSCRVRVRVREGTLAEAPHPLHQHKPGVSALLYRARWRWGWGYWRGSFLRRHIYCINISLGWVHCSIGRGDGEGEGIGGDPFWGDTSTASTWAWGEYYTVL